MEPRSPTRLGALSLGGLSLAALLLSSTATGAAPPVAAPPAPSPQGSQDDVLESVEALEDWLKRWRAGRIKRYDERRAKELQRLVAVVAVLAERWTAAREALLDTAGLELSALPPVGPLDLAPSEVERIRLVARAKLEGLLAGAAGPALFTFIAGEVLISPALHPLTRRLAALDVVRERRDQAIKMALLTAARQSGDPLRPMALTLLADWPDDLIDAYLVDGLGRPREPQDPHPFTLLLRRVRGHPEPLGSEAAEALGERLGVMLVDPDWREASRAIELARGLSTERVVPILIEGLSSWGHRAELGRGSRRIEHEILRELQRLSGRSIGPHADRWRIWWKAVQAGTVELAAPEEEAGALHSSATFFGLRPISDRVTFIIDRSGSMQAGWGTTGHSRYEEAVEQLVRYLQAAGEETRFNVVLFSSQPVLSSRELVPATAERLEQTRRSLLEREPEGGTRLRPAIQLALGVDSKGVLDLEQLEADTVIVLCDGETDQGRHWVQPWLDGINAEARVVFHCVLLGTSGDGTLEALATGTGGDFLRVGG